MSSGATGDHSFDRLRSWSWLNNSGVVVAVDGGGCPSARSRKRQETTAAGGVPVAVVSLIG